MMFRDRSVRVFPLLVLVVGSAAIVGPAGAQWTVPTAYRVPASHRTPTTARSTTADRRPLPAPRRTPSKKLAPVSRPVLWLPRSLPAAMLPAGSRLPNPEPAPSAAWSPRVATRLGQITIPAIGLDQPFFEGVDQAAFAHGAGHWPGTAAPGGWGNAVFGGHRVTETHPFLDLDKVRAGDEVDLITADGWTSVYRVTKVFVVSQTAMWIADQKAGRTLTLFTCHPKGSAAERLVASGVLLRLVAPR
jgi:LPXTG-site transpeptidase (sortase) family protein